MQNVRTMNKFKKITYLLLITAFFSGNVKAQSSPGNQKITITNFKVNEKNDQLIIDWATDGAVATNYWQLQSSTDGKRFSTFALVFGPDPRQPGDSYQYRDKIKKETLTKTYYRLSHIDKDGKEINSEIIQTAK